MLKKSALFTVLFIMITLFVRAQTGEEILDKSIKAAGGYETIKNIKTTIAHMSMNIQGMDLKMAVYFKKPAFRTETDMMGQKMIMAFDGQKGWMTNVAQGGVTDLPEDAIKQMKEQAEISNNPLIQYKEPGAKIEKLGKEKVDEKTCFKLKLTNKNEESIIVYIDSEDFLLRKVERTDNGNASEIKLQDYRKVGDILVPYLYAIKAQGMDMELKMDKFEVNPQVEDSLFAKPENK